MDLSHISKYISDVWAYLSNPNNITGIIALLIAIFSEPFKKWWHKSSLSFAQPLMVKQTSTLQVCRIPIRNSGIKAFTYTAQDVEVNVEEIYDNGEKRSDFVPSPLRFTHQNTSRNIAVNQTVLLDLFEWISSTQRKNANSSIKIAAPNINGLPDMPYIETGTTILHLHLFQQSGQDIKRRVKIVWNGSDPPETTIV